MYQPIDRQAGASALPTTLPNPVELVLFRSYQVGYCLRCVEFVP